MTTTLDHTLPIGSLFQDLEEHFNDVPNHLEQYDDQGGSWLETTSDLHAFMNALPATAETDENEDVEAVIQDMEQFLQSCEQTKKPSEDMLAAEALLDELIKGSPASPEVGDDIMIDLTNVNKVITEDGQEVFIVIDQLKDHDYSQSPESNSRSKEDSNQENLDQTPITSEDMDAAEDLLDELLKSNDFNWDVLDGDQEVETVIHEVEQFLQTVEHPPPKTEDQTPVLEDHHMDFSNVTKVITDEGKEIIIMIAPPSPPTASLPPIESSPPPTSSSWAGPSDNSSVSLNDDDPDWTPPQSSSIGRSRPALASRRSSYAKKRKSPYVTNRKERKKQQNVEAARRYRDKKKDEQSLQETEVELLDKKNKKLKSQVETLEAEVKTMKKIVKTWSLLSNP